MKSKHSKRVCRWIAAWTAVLVALVASAAEIGFYEDAEWRYFKGTSEASTPDTTAWRRADFDDSAWLTGPGPFFYEQGTGYTGNTDLTDMRSRYVTLFLRKAFDVPAPELVSSITLDLRVDDGCIVWINGHEIARVNMPEGEPAYTTTAINADQEPYTFNTTFVPDQGLLRAGRNVIAVQAANVSLSGSSDFLFAASLKIELDDRPPRIESVFPPPGSSVRELTSVEISFNRAVRGVDAGDLIVNGVPATGLQVLSPADYTFTFPEPPEGLVAFAWAPNHGITDTTPDAMPFVGTDWSCTLNKSMPEARVIISEFLADNGTGIRDRDGARSEWIELRNLSDEPVSLEGWFLTDDVAVPAKWRFPEVVLGPTGYLLVWASGKDRTSPELHTNFKLSKEGEYLALLDSNTNVIDAFSPAYPPQRTDISYGRDLVDPSITGYFLKPTPGAANASGGPGFAPDPVFSVPGGLYVTNRLVIGIQAPSGTIYYSTNGVPPSPTTGIRYTGPVTVSASVVFQARVYQDGLLPSRVVAECYQLVAASLSKFSSNLPLLIIQPVQPGISGDSASRTPVFVTAIDTVRGRAALLGPAMHRGMGGLNVRGQSSRGFPKQPYRLELTDPAGVNQNVPLFGLPANDDWVLHGPYSDKSLLNNFLSFELHERMGHYAVRRKFVEVFIDETGGPLTYPTDYRGIYVLLEKIEIDNNRVEVARMGPSVTTEPEITGGYIFKKDKDSPGDLNFTTRGGAGFNAQYLKYHDPKPREINTAQRNWLRNYLNAFEEALYASDWLTRTGARHYSAFIDIDSFVDNHWIVEFTKQIDGYRLSNYFHKDRGGKVKMDPIWDWNLSLGNANYLEGENPSGWYWTLLGADDHIWLRRLITGTTSTTTRNGDPDFNQAIIDRWSVLRTNIFNPTNILARIDEIAAYLNESKDREFSRWPRLNTYVWPNPSIYIQPTYAQIIANKKNWVRDRFNWIDSQFLRSPEFNLAPGFVKTGTLLSMTAPADSIYYTLDGTDPRMPRGAIRPQASLYSGPIRLDRNVRVFARARQGTNWSGPAVGTFVTVVPKLRISEIMFSPMADGPNSETDPDDYEFIELVNAGNSTINLAGFRFTQGIQFDFSTGAVQSLPPGGRVVVAANRTALERRHSSIPGLAGEYTGRLDNDGETIRLVGPMDEVIEEFQYDGGWYPATRGVGFALVPTSMDVSPKTLNTAAGWRPGTAWLGTPGHPDPPPVTVPTVLITEVLANPGPGQRDAIELFNPGSEPVDITGWLLSDDLKTPKYRMPKQSVIPPGGFLVVDADQFNRPGAQDGFGLSSAGEEVYLFSATPNGHLTGYVHGFKFGASPQGATYGRHVISTGEEHFVLQNSTSLGGPSSGPRIGPVVISEIMYHPPDVFANGAWWDAPEDEYIELLNLANNPVPLFDSESPTNTWRVAHAVDFTFPQNITMLAGERLLLVGFDPVADRTQTEAFRAKYGFGTQVRLFGPWKGKLDNSNESIRLLAPLRLGTAENPTWTELVVDRVDYRDQIPWPPGADGFGFSLQRQPEHAYGNDPANWIASVPTPGGPPLVGTLPIIDEQPTGLATLVGRSATLQVATRAQGNPRFQWRKSDVPLPGATNATLQLLNLQISDAGDYDVIVWNDAGAVSSRPAPVRVAAPNTDTDADGMNDLYELTHGLDPTWQDDLDADPDRDGMSTGAEYVAGTNPLDQTSKLAFDLVSFDDNGIKLEFNAALDRTYSIQVSSSLAADAEWRELARVPIEDIGSAALRLVGVIDRPQPIAGARYYRIKADLR